MEVAARFNRIYLIGMMGSGKSYWAGRLGHYLGLAAYDLDELIEVDAGKTIKEIFSEDGESAFRQKESDILKHHIPSSTFVIATGGGAPCFFDNIDHMKKKGLVLWLNPPIDELVKRLSNEIDSRPVLQGIAEPDKLAAHLSNLLAQRSKWYSKADIIVEDASPELGSLVEKIHAFKKEIT